MLNKFIKLVYIAISEFGLWLSYCSNVLKNCLVHPSTPMSDNLAKNIRLASSFDSNHCAATALPDPSFSSWMPRGTGSDNRYLVLSIYYVWGALWKQLFCFWSLLLYYTTYLIVVTVWVEILWVWESQIPKEQLGIAFWTQNQRNRKIEMDFSSFSKFVERNTCRKIEMQWEALKHGREQVEVH